MKIKAIIIAALMIATLVFPCTAFADVTYTVNDDGEVTTYTEEEFWEMAEEQMLESGHFVTRDEYDELVRDYERYEQIEEGDTNNSVTFKYLFFGALIVIILMIINAVAPKRKGKE